MDELIERLVALGIDRTAAEKAVGIVLDFLVREGPADKVRPFLAKLPGAEALMAKTTGDGSDDAGAGGGGFLGGGMGGIMGAGMQMMAVGLSMGQVQSVAREVLAYSREKAGEEAVAEAIAAIPGLAQFV
jgi:hypothetical protein